MAGGGGAHTRAAAVAAFASLVMNGRMVVPLRPRQTSATFSDELAEQKLQAVIGDTDDWAGEGAIAAAGKAGSFGIAGGGTSSFDVQGGAGQWPSRAGAPPSHRRRGMRGRLWPASPPAPRTT